MFFQKAVWDISSDTSINSQVRIWNGKIYNAPKLLIKSTPWQIIKITIVTNCKNYTYHDKK